MTVESTASPMRAFVLPERLSPTADPSGLDAPYFEQVRLERLVIQRCGACGQWQWGPEWLCYVCHSFDLRWEEVPKVDGAYTGVVYSWERVWHPIEPVLADAVPYVAVLVVLPTAGDIRMLGNLVGDPVAPVEIGTAVEALFEHHEEYTLVQWKRS